MLSLGPNYTERDYEHELKDDQRSDDYGSGQFEVLEYWGIMDAEYAREIGMDIADDIDDLDEVQLMLGFVMASFYAQSLIHLHPCESLIMLSPTSETHTAFLELVSQKT